MAKLEIEDWEVAKYSIDDYKSLYNYIDALEYEEASIYRLLDFMLNVFMLSVKKPSVILSYNTSYNSYSCIYGIVCRFKICCNKDSYFKTMDCYKALYITSYEDLPLYLNSQDKAVQKIVSWRLRNNK